MERNILGESIKPGGHFLILYMGWLHIVMINSVIAQFFLYADGKSRSQCIAVLQSNCAFKTHHIQRQADDVIVCRKQAPDPLQSLKVGTAISYK